MQTDTGAPRVIPPQVNAKRSRLRALLFACFAFAMVLSACTSETQDAIRDAVEQQPDDGDSGEAPAPEPEEPAPEPEEPAPEEPAPEPADEEDSLSSEDWLIIALLAVAAFALILGATSLSSNRSRRKDEARASFNRSVDQVIGGSRWIHDQACLDVLSANDPERLRSIWNTSRSRIVAVEGDVAALAAGVRDAQLQQSLTYLGQTLADLRNVLESNVALRLEPIEGREQLVQSSNQAVYDRRPQLLAAIAPVSAARR